MNVIRAKRIEKTAARTLVDRVAIAAGITREQAERALIALNEELKLQPEKRRV